MNSTVVQSRATDRQLELLRLLMKQWGCVRVPELFRKFLRIASVSGPPSREALEILHAVETLPPERQDVIDEKILEIAKTGVPLRGDALLAKLRRLLDDPESVGIPRPFACQTCGNMVVIEDHMTCALGENILMATPCPMRAPAGDPQPDGKHWNEEQS